MRTSALEQLANRGLVTIQKKGGKWLVERVRIDGYGFLTDRQSAWGDSLDEVLKDLLEKVTLAE